jgi:hypothetical protein
VRGSELVFRATPSGDEESRKGLFGESRMGTLDSGVTGGEFGTEQVIMGVVVPVAGLRLDGGGETGG